MSVILKTPSNGSVTLAEQDTASNVVVTVPAINGTAVVVPIGEVYSPYTGFKNRIINGSCLVAQRGNTAAALGVWTYGGCDRIMVLPVSFTTATGTISQISGYGASGFAQGVTLTTTGSGSVNFESRLEYRNTFDLNSNSVTFTARVYQDTGSALNTTLTITKANSQDNFSSKTTLGASTPVSVSSGVTTTLTFTLALGASDASSGLSVQVNFAGVGAVTSKTFLVTDLQLEKGSTATPFEFRSYGQELALCQRYYLRVTTGAYPEAVHYYARSTQALIGSVLFPVTMRAKPSLQLNSSGSANTIIRVETAVTLSFTPVQTWWSQYGLAGMYNATAVLVDDESYGFGFLADAEL